MEPNEHAEYPVTPPWYRSGAPGAAAPGTPWPGATPVAPPPPPSTNEGPTRGVATPPRPPSAKRPHIGRRLVAGCAAAVLVTAGGFAGGLVASRVDGSDAASSSPALVRTVADRTTNVSASSGSTIDATAVVAKMRTSVVAIQAQVTSHDGPWTTQGEAEGTGIVIDDGYILTNAHVVEGATSLSVTLPGRADARSATLIGSDSSHDVALIRVADTTGLTAADLASSDDAEVGEAVVAIGNALGLEGSLTVTQGIVSAVDRSIQTSESSELTGLLQTDAAISSGNSGGALVDAEGKVIGMNTAVASSGGQVQASNIGFAIPIQAALEHVAAWRDGNGSATDGSYAGESEGQGTADRSARGYYR